MTVSWQYQTVPVSIGWEYQCLPLPPTREPNLSALNEAGAAGWELCHILHDRCLMKRIVYRQTNAGYPPPAAA